VKAPDGSVQDLERRDAALLALLAIDGPTSRSNAAALLWGDADSDHQRGSLRQRIFHLRPKAGADLISAGEVLALAETVEHDLGAIAARVQDDPDAGSGELLGRFDYSDCPMLDEWVAAAREKWRTQRIHALAELAARLEADGRLAAALPYAERIVAADPSLEHAHRRLMRLHYLRGDRAAALGAFMRCRQLLRNHLGAAPGSETLELARLIEQTALWCPPAGSSFRGTPKKFVTSP
jgi:DNA-binding SARP family transcriptional activator